MRNHRHRFKITIAEVDADGVVIYTKNCKCGEVKQERVKSGIWMKGI